MKNRQFKCLGTTHKESIEIGTRIHHVRYRFKAPDDAPVVGAIKSMEQCDSGIFLHVLTDLGETITCHVRTHIYGGVMMDDADSSTKILKIAPRQISLNGFGRAA